MKNSQPLAFQNSPLPHSLSSPSKTLIRKIIDFSCILLFRSTKFQTHLGTGNTAVSNTVKPFPQRPNILMRQGRQSGNNHSCSTSDKAKCFISQSPLDVSHLFFSLCPFHSLIHSRSNYRASTNGRALFRCQGFCTKHEGVCKVGYGDTSNKQNK